MTTAARTQQAATWRTAARLRARVHACTSMLDGRINGNAYGIKPSTSEVTFPAIRPTRRGAPPL
jgi:hypothetical protein